MGVDDALELLGPGFTNRGVRAFAVQRLERADDDELLLYLLQLVQALKFEYASQHAEDLRSGRGTHRKREPSGQMDIDSGLSQFLIDRSVVNALLGTSFHWYLMIECDARGPIGKMYAKVAFRFMSKLTEVNLKAD